MNVITASTRKLKSGLLHYLRLTKAGNSVQITERGVPIGWIVPTAMPLHDRIRALADAGLLAWNQHKLAPRAPVAQAKGKKTVAELLIDGRG